MSDRVRIVGDIRFRVFETENEFWIGTSDDIRVTFQSDSWSNVHEDIEEILLTIIDDCYQDGDLEDWLKEHNLTMTGDYSDSTKFVEIPYSLEIVKSADRLSQDSRPKDNPSIQDLEKWGGLHD